MSFKDALNDDISAIFLDESEFAQKIDIDGQEVLAIMEEITESIKSGSKGGFTNGSALGLFSHDVTLYVKESDLEDRPLPNSKIYIDDLAYAVADTPNAIVVQDGLLILMLVKRYS